ncbi:MAG: sugar transferase [Chloroflexi bacterium]|jgi:exopolysaccharide biosynthesis polyprenyl glycosylphosphotransferase|nr:sugar transferase [Chloroflexota bacterium]MBT3670928.1 sugar transferase [Chloroflexota bacterium]MBT4003400.1 sugar transferase [Chloroflexota bacterium]MBT4306358.1 sugar transferase [Chloroflexota bacterium]MBT4532761.1 sugar transferase [Chloroflexota bacterium]
MAIPKKDKKPKPWRLRLGERRTLIVIGDLAMAAIALVFGIYFWAIAAVDGPLEIMDFVDQRLQPWFLFLPLIWVGLLADSYDARKSNSLRNTTIAVASSALIGLILYMAVYFASSTSLPRRGVAAFLIAASILTMFWRLIYIQIFSRPQFMNRVLIVGAGVTGIALLKVIDELIPPPFFVVGLVDKDPEKIGKTILGYPVLGASDKILGLIKKEKITDIIVSIGGAMSPFTIQTLLTAQENGIEITRMPRAYEDLLGRVPVNYLETDWIIRSFVDEARVSAFFEIGKRILDIIGGLIGVIILALISPIIALAIYLETGRPIIFSQTRSGKGGEPFTILKFRTMRQDAEADGKPQLAEEHDDRATKVGRFLRKTHLDEWMQFINVLRGEMSIVGPRPERPELVAEYEKQIPFYRARLLAKPGIAGWAQVNVNYFSTLDEMSVKLEYDLYYIKRRNILMDIYIILRTVATVIGFRGR